MRAVVLLPNVTDEVGEVGAALEEVLGDACGTRAAGRGRAP